jgi:predicted DNA-binding transcriptional regulator YafY
MGKTKSGRRGRPIEEVMTAIVATLRKRDATKGELVQAVGRTSLQTVQKALDRLRNEHDAPVAFDARSRSWALADTSFALPLDAPEPEDLVAVLVAEAIAAPLADEGLRRRLRRLAEQMDDRLRAQGSKERSRTGAIVSSSLSLGTKIDPLVLHTVLGAVRAGVLRVLYYSPWKDQRERVTIEPWEVRIHDGAVYLRAWCREASGARTYRMVHVESVKPVAGARPTVDVPIGARVWGDGHPAYGIDHDRPGEAIIVLRGAVARWVHGVIWHPLQRDRWLERGERLERRMPYRSCRESARRVLSVLDAVESVEPDELRVEIDRCVRNWR